MSIWRAVPGEAVGSWRSLLYDLMRPAPSPDDADPIFPEYRTSAHHRPHWRAVAAGGIGTLVLSGAVGTYAAVVGGLAAPGHERSGTPPDRPPAVVNDNTPTSHPTAAAPSPTRSASWTGRPPRRPTTTAGSSTASATPTRTCSCTRSPVPRPSSTPPASASPTPSRTGSSPTPSPDPTPSDPTPTPSNSLGTIAQ